MLSLGANSYKNSHLKGPIITTEIKFSSITQLFRGYITKYKIHFLHCWLFVKGIHWSMVNCHNKGPLLWSFEIFFDVRLNKLMYKQQSYLWFMMHWSSCHVTLMFIFRVKLICLYFVICQEIIQKHNANTTLWVWHYMFQPVIIDYGDSFH